MVELIVLLRDHDSRILRVYWPVMSDTRGWNNARTLDDRISTPK